ncbi:hypothetical protein GGR52DRAFT_363125 [Hypoxylon sp. FL1284]|nr:hypothetical protein GGR52DRAFT_363125 [Hypoxylon sp. FL1284]
MKITDLIAGLSLLAPSALALDAPPPEVPRILGIVSDTPSQCAPGQSLSVDVQPDVLRLGLPAMRFDTTGHGRTDEVATCQFTLELTSWWYKYRFAVQDVTYRGHLQASDGVQLYQLTANTVFRYENRKVNPGREPPDVWNVSMSTMIDDQAPTTIGGEGEFDDDFEVSRNGSHLEWSTCMDGGEGGGDVRTKLAFLLTATTSDKTGEGSGALTGGLSLDFGLAWEECVPDRLVKNAWGQTRIDDWSVCTYNDSSLAPASGSSAFRRGTGALL